MLSVIWNDFAVTGKPEVLIDENLRLTYNKIHIVQHYTEAFMSALFTVASRLITLFIYVIIGYIISRWKVVSQQFTDGISRFLMTVILPCMIISTFQTPYTAEKLARAGLVFLVSLVIFGLSILIGYLTYYLFHIEKEAKGVWIYAVTFPNHAFMGWPVMAAVFGGDAVFYATFANMAFSVYAYTFGVWLMQTTGKQSSYTNVKNRHVIRDNLLTPINAGIVIGLILFFTQFQIPAAIDSAVDAIGGMTTPLAMMYVGTILAKSPLREVFLGRKVYLCSLVRLILIPMLVFICARPFITDPLIYGVLVIGHAMPVAGYCAIYAGAYDNDTLLASKLISVTTLLSVITIPVIAMWL